MSLTLAQTATAVAPNIQASFQGIGGTEPYAYSVRPGGVGGTIDGSTGFYLAPRVVISDPNKIYDTIQVLDAAGAVAIAKILVGNPLLLVCDIIQNQMGLADGQVYLWDQKIKIPNDSRLYVTVSVLNPKVFGNTVSFDSDGNEIQSINVASNLSIDIFSRGPDARDRKEEVVMALRSVYAEQQMDANSFAIARVPNAFVNISEIDGAAIPYRFNISVVLQYFVQKSKPIPYFDSIQTPVINTNS